MRRPPPARQLRPRTRHPFRASFPTETVAVPRAGRSRRHEAKKSSTPTEYTNRHISRPVAASFSSHSTRPSGHRAAAGGSRAARRRGPRRRGRARSGRRSRRCRRPPGRRCARRAGGRRRTGRAARTSRSRASPIRPAASRCGPPRCRRPASARRRRRGPPRSPGRRSRPGRRRGPAARRAAPPASRRSRPVGAAARRPVRADSRGRVPVVELTALPHVAQRVHVRRGACGVTTSASPAAFNPGPIGRSRKRGTGAGAADDVAPRDRQGQTQRPAVAHARRGGAYHLGGSRLSVPRSPASPQRPRLLLSPTLVTPLE